MVTDEMVDAAIRANTNAKLFGGEPRDWVRAALEAALSAAEPQPAPSVAVKADLPERFEEWWTGRDSKGEKTLNYNQRKQLAWDAFHAAALSAQVQDVAGLEALAKAAQDYVDAVSGEPEKDCWDTEDGKEAHGAERFASDWAWKDYDDAKQKAFDNLRAMLAAAPAKQEG